MGPIGGKTQPDGKTKDWKKLHKLKKEKKFKLIQGFLDEVNKLEEKPKEVVSKGKHSVAIAVPGSILDRIPTAELQTYVVGQVARAAAIFKVNEIIVFDDTCTSESNSVSWLNCLFMAKVLEYLECPQYLRKHFFPYDEDLKNVGVLNPLGTPHHLKQEQLSTYREGVVLDEERKGSCGSTINVGLVSKVKVEEELEPGIRVTVKIPLNPKDKASVVSPIEPSTSLGIYWGYKVRVAKSLSEVFSKSPYKKGYNVTIGTSDKGSPHHEFQPPTKRKRRVLIAFGGLTGLEFALKNDEKLSPVSEVSSLFDYYLNTCPSQGSRTIRTEEALLISLAVLSEKISP